MKVRRNAPELSSGTYHLSRLEFRHLYFLEIEFRHWCNLMVGRKDKYSNVVCLMYKTRRVARRPDDGAWTSTWGAENAGHEIAGHENDGPTSNWFVANIRIFTPFKDVKNRRSANDKKRWFPEVENVSNVWNTSSMLCSLVWLQTCFQWLCISAARASLFIKCAQSSSKSKNLLEYKYK